MPAASALSRQFQLPMKIISTYMEQQRTELRSTYARFRADMYLQDCKSTPFFKKFDVQSWGANLQSKLKCTAPAYFLLTCDLLRGQPTFPSS